MPVEHIECPLCHGASIAEPQRLYGGGYEYQCPTCGGPFEVGTSAQAHAEKGGIHPQAIEQMQKLLAEGKRPRVEFIVATPNSYYSVTVVPPSATTELVMRA
ncbi:hypothetical protein [Cupriavidus sp. UME77]|uniref:hypothetical protein n=1 Tax=Cupriavidus sp. UME77 TaxID=1862321 RepID=UPI001600CA3E|nr:hypothetical protein [Cupriavidus sp. UME77]MBB1634953.1 hypothetical protein [Cupriavidus sp. UME77]